MRLQKIIVLLLYTLLLEFKPTESCLPSWFREERSAEPLEGKLIVRKIEDTNEIGEYELPATTIQTAYAGEEETIKMNETIEGSNDVEDAEKMLETTENEYQYEYIDGNAESLKEEEEAIEGLKYNEDATNEASATFTPEVSREIEKLKEAKCRDYCHHNATCHVEVIFHDSKVSAVVPSCHCPHGWEGTRCDRHYVPAFYAPVSRYNVRFTTSAMPLQATNGITRPRANLHAIVNTPSSNKPSSPAMADFYQILWQSSSTVPAFAVLLVMLSIFVAIVLYAYRRMSKRSDDVTYTMSHICPPEAFTVLKTPNGHKITVNHQDTVSETTRNGKRVPMRAAAMKSIDPNNQNNLFSILRKQGTIPSRNINDDDTPKHYKSVPRVDVSAINYSGHIDFSTISYPSSEEPPSRPHRTTAPPPHISIEMEEMGARRSRSRAGREPATPTSNEPMVFGT